MIITRAPLRISLLGGNTDFPEYYEKYGGLVLTTAINKYVYCIVTKRFDSEIRVNYSIKECVKRVDELKHELVREAMRLVGVEDGIEITFYADIPSEGTGLGSSSSVTVATLQALHCYKGEYVSSETLAKEACQIELDILKKPIGVQDQYIAALGGIRILEFPNGGRKLVLDSQLENDLENHLMLFYSGITRSSAEILGNMKFDKNILDENKILAKQGAVAIEQGDFAELGTLLNRYWDLKKTLNTKVTNSQLDQMYQLALKAGAYGGKVIGAGGGGFLLVLTANRNKIRDVLQGYKELIVRLEPWGSRIILDTRT